MPDDVIGRRFGRLTVIELIPGNRAIGKRPAYRCACDCGAETISAAADVRRGNTSSCGCFKRERMRTLRLSHNRSRSPEYSVWHMMKDRCYNTRAKAYPYYGGRGIAVCDRWRESFSAFFADMGPRPSLNHSIDRLNNDIGYEPLNCEWRTSHVQSRNRRSTRMLTAFGQTQCLSDWAVEYGMKVITLHRRLQNGIPLEDALTIPLNHNAQLRSVKT